ncbi:Gfo/Idh/MocA family oxidoreductase [Cypionkella sp.]|uniref:Gfo/Idh/MocA family oxidoreductase n=1 Tax=Cypionkella sp. TaxID=2811411 RepID=UPI002607C37B|nr:Gfo/Idh/MocA family oxidoreductase [Cypionkella sp.]MDB5665068.1 iolG1 [Cypionkella sp.]
MSLAVGVIGTGVMGAEHARLLREEINGAQLAAVCDADAGRADAAAQGAAVFTDALGLIRSDKVEVVVIASPDATHAELALACIAAGKPVLCEKPIAATAAEGLQIVEAEASLGLRLVTVGFMRRFDAGYVEMRAARIAGQIGAPVLLHNIHRNVSAPEWFTGAMAVTNSLVHEIDISRWLLGSEFTSAQVTSGPGGDPMMVTMQTDKGEIVSTEVYMNAVYGYHVHAQLVGRQGSIEMAVPARLLVNQAAAQSFSFPPNWVPRFADAYRSQMQAWVNVVQSGGSVGASAWDGFVTTSIAEQIVGVLASGDRIGLSFPPRPELYD